MVAEHPVPCPHPEVHAPDNSPCQWCGQPWMSGSDPKDDGVLGLPRHQEHPTAREVLAYIDLAHDGGEYSVKKLAEHGYAVVDVSPEALERAELAMEQVNEFDVYSVPTMLRAALVSLGAEVGQ